MALLKHSTFHNGPVYACLHYDAITIIERERLSQM